MFRVFLVVLLAHAFPGQAKEVKVATRCGLTDQGCNVKAAEEVGDHSVLLQTSRYDLQQRQYRSPKWPGIQYTGAGLSRTGTESMMIAMDILREKPTHGEEFKEDGSVEKAAMRKAKSNWGSIAAIGKADMLDILHKENVTSVFDAPLNGFVELFMKKYDSKVILTIHPLGADGWVDSCVKFSRYWPLDSRYQTPPFFPPNFQPQGCKISVTPSATITDEMRQICKKQYEAYNAKIISSVPEDRLLVFNVSTGWRPLCEFLGVAEAKCPYSQPFPHSDNVDDKQKALCHSSCPTNVSKCISLLDGKLTQSIDNDVLLASIPKESRYPCDTQSIGFDPTS